MACALFYASPFNSNQNQDQRQSQYKIYSGEISSDENPSNTNRDQSFVNLELHEDFSAPNPNEDSSWKPIQRQKNHYTIENYNGEISNYHKSSKRNGIPIHQNLDYKKKNKSIFNDLYDSKGKTRVRRETGRIIKHPINSFSLSGVLST